MSIGKNIAKYRKSLGITQEELGVKLIQSHAPMGRPLADEDGSFLRDTAKCVEACGKMGIPNVVVHSGYLKDITKEECFERNKRFFMPLLELGEKYNVDILVENFNKMVHDDVYWIDNAHDLQGLGASERQRCVAICSVAGTE